MGSRSWISGADSGDTDVHVDKVAGQINQVSESRGTAAASMPGNRQTAEHPSESRIFSLVEMFSLMTGFGIAGGVISFFDIWPANLFAAEMFFVALGLSLCGPVLVSWRERLGRRRANWGLGESLWFCAGVVTQSIILAAFVAAHLDAAPAIYVFLVSMIVIPVVCLTGNPNIELRRAPWSWSNVVGMLCIVCWVLFGWGIVVAIE